MKLLQAFLSQCALLWKFLGFFQTPFIRLWHLLGIVLILLQLCLFLNFSFTDFINESHVERGLLLLPFLFLFLCISFKRRGFKYFFSYLWGDVSLLQKDIQTFLQGRVPAPKSGGLAGTIQGFGLLAFFLTLLCGFFLYLSWYHDVNFIIDFYSLHKYTASALLLYLFVHAAYSIKHFLFWKKTVVKK